MNRPQELCYCQAARRSARFLSRTYDRHLSPTGLNVQQFSILSLIAANEGVTIAALADEMVIDRTTLVRALKPLQDSGFVSTKPAGKWGSLSLKLTRDGKKRVLDGDSLWQDAQREFEAKFGKVRAGQLREEMKQAFATE